MQIRGALPAVGEEPALVALAWLLHNPAVTAPIAGSRTVEQLTESLRALQVSLSEDTLHRLDEIGPVQAVRRPKPTPGRTQHSYECYHFNCRTKWRTRARGSDLHILLCQLNKS